MAETGRALRRLVAEAFPEAVEQVDFGNRLLAVGKTMAMRDLTFAIIPHSAHVNLQLANGAELPDDHGLIEGTGKRIRHVKVRSVDAPPRRPCTRSSTRRSRCAGEGGDVGRRDDDLGPGPA